MPSCMRLPRQLPQFAKGAIPLLLVTGTLYGVLESSLSAQVLYREGRVTVATEVDPDSRGTADPRSATHPPTLTSDQLTQVLRGITFRTDAGLVSTLLGSAWNPVFTQDDLSLLGPVLARALTEATPSEQIRFAIANPRSGQNLATTSGFLSVRDPYLRFALVDHPLLTLTRDNPSPKIVELEFVKQEYLRPASEAARSGSIKQYPMIEIDYRLYLSHLANPPDQKPIAARPALDKRADEHSTKASADPLTTLQQQIEELKHANLELRNEVIELRRRLDQPQQKAQDTSTSTPAEVARLRQELTEVKQLLAEKVLELNRLKSKSKTKPKAQAAPSP